MRLDRSHSNYNGAQVTGVEKRERKIPIEIQQQAVERSRREDVQGSCAGGGAVSAAAQSEGSRRQGLAARHTRPPCS
jgi:hypothetical protein